MTYTLIPGKPHTGSEEETISMIRSVLTDGVESEPVKRNRLRIVAKDPKPGRRDTPKADGRSTIPKSRMAFFELPDDEPDTVPPRASWTKNGIVSRFPRLPLKFWKSRPASRHLAFASTLLLILLRPFLVLLCIVFAIIVVAATFLFIGEDRVWGMVLRYLKKVEAKNPRRAAELCLKLDNMAYRWDGVLDRLPGGVADRFYMPDFQTLGHAEERHAAVMSERLERLVEQG